MAGTAVTFLSVTLAHVILRLVVAREIIGFLSVTDTYIQTISEMRRRMLPRAKALGNNLWHRETDNTLAIGIFNLGKDYAQSGMRA